jgi:hypothetical protein
LAFFLAAAVRLFCMGMVIGNVSVSPTRHSSGSTAPNESKTSSVRGTRAANHVECDGVQRTSDR